MGKIVVVKPVGVRVDVTKVVYRGVVIAEIKTVLT